MLKVSTFKVWETSFRFAMRGIRTSTFPYILPVVYVDPIGGSWRTLPLKNPKFVFFLTEMHSANLKYLNASLSEKLHSKQLRLAYIIGSLVQAQKYRQNHVVETQFADVLLILTNRFLYHLLVVVNVILPTVQFLIFFGTTRHHVSI